MLGTTFAGSPKDLVVHDEHDGHWNIESYGRGVEGVAHVLADQAHASRVDVLSPAAERGQGDGGRRQPHTHYHLGHQLPILPGRIGQRSCDAKVPLRSKRTKVKTRTANRLPCMQD